MKRVLGLILIVAIGMVSAAALGRPMARLERPADAPAKGRFFALDVVIGSGSAGLGAYQVEITPIDGDRAQLVGIEGGDAGVYADPPSYDPAALHAVAGFERVILAAFTAEGPAPVGKTRVARLHFHCEAGPAPRFAIRLMAAGESAGKRINASARLVPAILDATNDSRSSEREGASR